jgi:hypothetical protein
VRAASCSCAGGQGLSLPRGLSGTAGTPRRPTARLPHRAGGCEAGLDCIDRWLVVILRVMVGGREGLVVRFLSWVGQSGRARWRGEVEGQGGSAGVPRCARVSAAAAHCQALATPPARPAAAAPRCNQEPPWEPIPRPSRPWRAYRCGGVVVDVVDPCVPLWWDGRGAVPVRALLVVDHPALPVCGGGGVAARGAGRVGGGGMQRLQRRAAVCPQRQSARWAPPGPTPCCTHCTTASRPQSSGFRCSRCPRACRGGPAPSA